MDQPTQPVQSPGAGGMPLSTAIDAIGSVYNRSANPILALTSGTGALTLQLPSPITQAVTAGSGLALSGTGPLTLRFQPSTGIFSGAFKPSRIAGKYGGAIFQATNLGQGTYILGGTTGQVNLK